MRKRVLPLGMAIFLLLTALFPVWAIAEGEAAPTEVPMESVSPYRIILTAPDGWTSGNGAIMKVSITDKDKLGWQKIEYRMNDGNWVDCENLFADGRAELTLHENGTFILRMTDPHGHAFEESAEVTCIALTAPVLTASINGTTLQVDAKDDLSGVAGVQVNSMLFTTMTNGILNVELDQSMNQFEKLAVRAFDYAGNFSEPFTLTNPHYEKPADPTPVPTATPKPTKKPADEATATPTAVLAATNTPAPNRFNGLGSSLIYVQDEPDPTPEPTAAPTPETIIKTEYITIGPGMPYQADGNSHTRDVLYSAATNKQFITLQTKNGNTLPHDLDVDVARLKLMKADHQSKQFRLEDQLLKYFPQEVERDTQLIAGFQKDIATIEAHPLPQEDFVGMTVGDKLIMDKEEAGKAILAACKDAAKGAPVEFGSYRGLPMRVQFDAFINKFVLTLHGAVSHPMEVGNDARGNITRLDNAIAQIPKRLAATTEHLATVRQQIDAARAEAGRPFPQEAELRTKSARLAELDAALNMDRSSGSRQKDRSEEER